MITVGEMLTPTFMGVALPLLRSRTRRSDPAIASVYLRLDFELSKYALVALHPILLDRIVGPRMRLACHHAE